jgi:hypothetical protein
MEIIMADLEELFEAPSMTLDEAVTEYIRLDKIIKEATMDKSWAASILVANAEVERGSESLKTVHIERTDGEQRVKVEFRTGWSVLDSSQMEAVKELLGEKRFAELFKIEYTPKMRALQTFLNTSTGDEAFRTAKAIVREIVSEVPKTPAVSVERS